MFAKGRYGAESKRSNCCMGLSQTQASYEAYVRRIGAPVVVKSGRPRR